MALGVLVVIWRLEPADGFAHEREVAGQWTDREDNRLNRIVPGPVRTAVPVEEGCRQTAAARNAVTSIDIHDISVAGR